MDLINKQTMLKALELFERKLDQPLKMLMGGGGAMVLAHDFPLGTYDIDAVPIDFDFADLDVAIKAVAKELNIAPDWLNPYFSTFVHTLPADYKARVIRVYDGEKLKVDALGLEDMLVLKIFAGRQKDVPHVRQLIKKGVNLKLVEDHLAMLKKKRIPNVDKALDFLDDVSEAD
jgi:hypothetical protein